ncbi:SCO2400 family protein, partial [Streptomyces sp. 24-1644]|uniref:SCO2400 family protein n=1 Tax=Streptomyces sp. 24-1644 TaxID=3457315 RepID=UPI003FA6EBAB
MDYCRPCRRHLNGALACAECGTPAEALGPYAVPAYSGHEPEPREESCEPSVAAGRRRRAAEPVRGRSAGRGAGRRG